MKRLLLVALLLAIPVVVGSTNIDNAELWLRSDFYRNPDNTGSWVRTVSYRNPENACFTISLGKNAFVVCGIDNAGKLLVDDCAAIGFAHSWVEEEELVSGYGSVLRQGPDGIIYYGPSYNTKHTRRCRNCTVKEEQYDEITKKWRRR